MTEIVYMCYSTQLVTCHSHSPLAGSICCIALGCVQACLRADVDDVSCKDRG